MIMFLNMRLFISMYMFVMIVIPCEYNSSYAIMYVI